MRSFLMLTAPVGLFLGAVAAFVTRPHGSMVSAVLCAGLSGLVLGAIVAVAFDLLLRRNPNGLLGDLRDFLNHIHR